MKQVNVSLGRSRVHAMLTSRRHSPSRWTSTEYLLHVGLSSGVQWWVYVLDGKEGKKQTGKKNNEQELYKARVRSTTSDRWDHFRSDDSNMTSEQRVYVKQGKASSRGTWRRIFTEKKKSAKVLRQM